LKWSLLRQRVREALRGFLNKDLEYDLYSDYVEDDLAEFLEGKLPEDHADSAQTMARKCARFETDDAVKKVKQLLADIGLTIGNVWEDARGRKARELMEQYERREPKALRLIHKILTGAGISMDALRADALTKQLDNIERIDRLATIAENRRNASLREIDRHRAVLGETLRRSVQEIEDAEFKMIETTPAKEKKAA
jgi:hypothetical protein